jgi:hypothetical protein
VHTFLVILACLPFDTYNFNDLSLLYHAATSREAGQQQSNVVYVLWMVPFWSRVSRKEV